MKTDDLLIEIHTEELPPKSLLRLSNAFKNNVEELLKKARFEFNAIDAYATPRRLALLVNQLQNKQPDQTLEKRGPAWKAAFDKEGNPTKACEGFAQSCGITVKDLQELKTDKGHWVSATVNEKGESINSMITEIIETALKRLPTPKNMRWGNYDTEFVRPIHSIVLLYGHQVLPATIMGKPTDKMTHGHRALHAKEVEIPLARDYADVLEKAHVIASFEKRKQTILDQIKTLEEKHKVHAHIDKNLLDEVTALVEWPVALLCDFDESFLEVPAEGLISAMQYHQKSFPVKGADGKLQPHFITISNIKSQDEKQVIEGNQRVMCARLSDAAFFYRVDQKTPLEERLSALEHIIYQKQLGSLRDKVTRIETLSGFIADTLKVDSKKPMRVAHLAKADLASDMVAEFPELQGIMGSYYAKSSGESDDVALAIKEHYKPAFSGDTIPSSDSACIVSLADRLDTLVGIFGIGLLPTGDKDPFALRRAALGIIRIITEKHYGLDCKFLLEKAIDCYDGKLSNTDVLQNLLTFINDRLRAFEIDKGIAPDVWASVSALGLTNISDIENRLAAVQHFKTLDSASALAAANKRVSNILSKQADALNNLQIDKALLEHDSEKHLEAILATKANEIGPLYQNQKYDDVLQNLSSLKDPVDSFFDDVLVMSEDEKLRNNRIALLSQLRQLFLKVADVALLQ